MNERKSYHVEEMAFLMKDSERPQGLESQQLVEKKEHKKIGHGRDEGRGRESRTTTCRGL